MRVALVNPPWSFRGSIYFGCREPHLPLELGWTRDLLEAEGHRVLLVDGHLFGLGHADIRAELLAFRPDLTVVTTAPTYLFWRCAPPELRVPLALLRDLDGVGGLRLAVGPHGSTTPRAVLDKLPVDGVVMGECEEVVAKVAGGAWEGLPGLAYREADGTARVNGGPQAAAFADRAPLAWPDGVGAAAPPPPPPLRRAARGSGGRGRGLAGLPLQLHLLRQGELPRPLPPPRGGLGPGRGGAAAGAGGGIRLLHRRDLPPQPPAARGAGGPGLKFGVQTRIDLWKPEMLELLGRAGCVSIEAGVESLTREGRDELAKNCKLETEELAERLVLAKRHVPFVQANLLEMPQDDAGLVGAWRDRLRAAGVWANDPVPLFPYPGSPDYRKLWGLPDDAAWERAVDHYLATFRDLSELQEARALPLRELEAVA